MLTQLVRRLTVVALAAVVAFPTLPPPTADAASSATMAIEPPPSVVDLLNPQHPRLLASPATFATASQRLQTDTRLQSWFAKVRRDADAMLGTTPKSPPNNLDNSREVKRRVYSLALVYRLTGDTRYAARATQELLAMSAYPDWNPSHFLDVGEMTNAVAVGYDWLHDYLSAAQRTTIRTAIETKALQPALEIYNRSASFYTQTHNWNLVCNSVALGALAIGDENPDLADQVLRKSISSIQNGISEYAPGGGYAESPVYWTYGTEYLVQYLAALKTAVGTDFGLSGLPGLSITGDFPIHVTGATGDVFNFGDGGTDLFGTPTSGWYLPSMMWMGTRYQRSHLASWQAARADRSASPLDILWYDPSRTGGTTHPTWTDWLFRGVDVATARSAWDDPYAVSVATKGLRAGYDQVVAHENLDAGDLVMDANGVRWFDDLGADSYSLPGYFDWRKNTGGRWDYYVARPEGQNTMQLGSGPDPQTALTNGAPVIETGSTSQQWYEITDLTGMYGGRVQRAQRGVKLFDDRRQLLIQDEVQAGQAIDYWSFLHTRADVTVAADGRSATLYRGGQRLWVQLMAPAGARLLVGDATPLPGSPSPVGQSAQAGIRKLIVNIPDVTNATIALRAVPLAAGQQPPSTTPAITPLGSWTPGSTTAAPLTGLVVGGKQLDGFDSQRFRYDVTLPWTAARAPKVVAETAGGAVAVVSQASELPGVATVTTYQTGRRGPTYEVHFRQPGKLGRAYAVASASASGDDGNAAANTVDGNLGSRWSAAGDGQYITYDLGRSRTLGAVAVAFYNGSRRTATFDVLTSPDGTTWSTARAGIVSSGTTDDLEVFSFPATTARYLRIVGHGNSVSNYNSIVEVRSYASTADAKADAPRLPVVLGSVSVTKPSELIVGESQPLSLTGTRTDGRPADLTGAQITWTSSTPATASVNAEGVVTAMAGGTASVAAMVTEPPVLKVARATFTVIDPSRVEVTADAFVRNGSFADTTYGNAAALEVRNNPNLGSGYDRVAYLEFDPSSIRGTVQSASLQLYGGIDDGTATSTVNGVYAVDGEWTESTLTWNNRPALGAELDKLTLDGTAAWRTADLTGYVQGQLAAGAPIRIAIASTVNSYGPHTAFNSKEATGNRPYLHLTFS
ncbi:DNRLRE domain-containing protein [Kribbella sp. NPDC050124]|uniref:CBM96 family carbohydrate-binding protein n=1 Tax=Kribbella sp. NPDC050124 TaxID=3364114 RepID=UPI00379BB689